MSLFAIGMPGPVEMAIIAIIAVILFGSQLPKVARSVGAAIPSFKKGYKEVETEIQDIGNAIES